MRIESLEQPPFNTSFMGVVQGAIDHFGVQCDPGRAYFGSGHGFVINVHTALCPSGPYCWNFQPFLELCGNVGIRAESLGVLLPFAEAEAKLLMEEEVRRRIDQGAICSLMSLDHQLILGYDDSGFITAQPWPGADSTPARLSYGSWTEYRNGPPVTFFKFESCGAVDESSLIRASLAYALDLWDHPANHTEDDYGMGPDAYDNWRTALEQQSRDTHGNWWNAMVWGECRIRISDYFKALVPAADSLGLSAPIVGALADGYRELGETIQAASDKSNGNSQVRDLIDTAAGLETRCIDHLRTLSTGIEQRTSRSANA